MRDVNGRKKVNFHQTMASFRGSLCHLSGMTPVNNNMTGAVCCGWLLLCFLGQLGAHLFYRGHPNEEE